MGRAGVDSMDRFRCGRSSRSFNTSFPRRIRVHRRLSGRCSERQLLSRTPGGTAVFGFMPVVPMVLISMLLMVAVSLLTRKPSEQTISRYFQQSDRG